MGIFVDRGGLGRATLIQVHVVDTGTTPTPTPTPIAFTHTVPDSMTIGQTYTVSFNGGYNVGQSGVTYTIAEGAGYASTSRHLSKTSGILPGENITLTWYGDTSNGHTVAVPSNITWDVMAMVGTAVETHSDVTFTLVAASAAVAVSEVFNTTLYSGTGAARALTTGQDLAHYGGMVHIKPRNDTGSNLLYHYGRGPISALNTDNNSAAYVDPQSLLGFDSNGFSLGTGASTGNINTNYVAWVFRNALKFYGHKTVTKVSDSPVAATFPELVTLGMVRVKRIDGDGDWYVWHRSLPPGNMNILINNSDRAASGAQAISVSETTVTLAASQAGQLSAGGYLVEAWAHDESASGIIKCGEIYTAGDGSGTADLGWPVQYVELKCASSSGGWEVYDLERSLPKRLLENSVAGEDIVGRIAVVDPTGFTIYTGNANTRFIYRAVRADERSGLLTGTINHSSFVTAANAGATGTLTLSGVTSNIGTPTYSISEQGTSYFTFSKTSGIASNENVSWSLAVGAPTGTVTFNISANTSPTASNGPMTVMHTFQVTGAVVTPTMSGTINHTIPSSVTGSNNYNVQIGGKTTTSGTVNYGITVIAGSQYVSFSKTAGISNNETVVMSIASNAPNGGSIVGRISANTTPVTASNGPDSEYYAIDTSAAYEPDPTFSGFSNTLPANTEPGKSYQVTFSGTTSSNGRSVWYTLQPQTGLSFSKTDNINPGESITMTVGSGATGTLSVTIYANTTKTNGSIFTQNLTNVQTTVQVHITIDWSQARVSFTVVNNPPQNQYGVAQYNAPCSVHVMGVTASNGSNVKLKVDGSIEPTGAVSQGGGMLFTSQRPYVEYYITAFANDGTIYADLIPWKNLVPAGAYPFTDDYNYSAYPWPQTNLRK